MNEADTCRVLITPSLRKSGWGDPTWRIAEQYYFTDGQIILVGDAYKRQAGKKADYILRYEESLSIAVVEAKAEDLDPAAGLQQAKEYAKILGLYFAYSTNGHGFAEWDFTINAQRILDKFPTPEDLWQRLCLARSLDIERFGNPLLTQYCAKGNKLPRYYQEVAINRTIEAILKGQKRILCHCVSDCMEALPCEVECRQGTSLSPYFVFSGSQCPSRSGLQHV